METTSLFSAGIARVLASGALALFVAMPTMVTAKQLYVPLPFTVPDQPPSLAAEQPSYHPSATNEPSDFLVAGTDTDTATARLQPAEKQSPPHKAIKGQATFAAGAVTQPVEIVELARALKNDPDLIFEYVYNNIETIPQYGSLKGARGALIDGKGTAFDQAELMVALLNQAGIPASFQIGSVELPLGYLSQWLGTDSSIYGPYSIFLNGGFIPTALSNSSGSYYGIRVGWAWVAATIEGSTYVFDPATKNYDRTGGLTNLATILDYNRSTLIADAEGGATITPASIANLNRAKLRSDLDGYAKNLMQYIRTQNPQASLAQVIGGKSIHRLPFDAYVRQTSLYYSAGTITSTPTLASDYRTTLTLQLGWNAANGTFTPLTSPVTFNTPDVYGHRLIVSLNGASVPSLLLDGAVQASASAAAPAGSAITIRASVVHPYNHKTFANLTNDDRMKITPMPNGLYLIGTGWGSVDRAQIENHRKLLLQNRTQNPSNPTAEPVLGESLATLGYTWLAERSRYAELLDELAGTVTIFHHSLGITALRTVTANQTGPYVDLPINGISSTQRRGKTFLGSTATEQADFFHLSLFSSIAESGVLEQTQPGNVAVSTVKLVDLASQGGTIYDINDPSVPGSTAASYTATIRPILAQTYSTADLARIDSLVTAGRRIVAPAKGNLAQQQWNGAGYFTIAQDGTSIGAIITGGLSGGFSGVPIPPETVSSNTSSYTLPPVLSSIITSISGGLGRVGGFISTLATGEPINLVSGDYFNTYTDLTVGGPMPYGLSFQRYYDSGTRNSNGPLGQGWNHNFAISATADSDAFAGMGALSPISASSSLAALFVTQDLLNVGTGVQPGLDRMIVASLAQRWLIDQLTTNVVSVAQAQQVEQFVKLSDGSYNAPLGSASVLTLANGTYSYTAKDGTQLAFNAAGNIASWSSPAGSQLTFTYDSAMPPKLTKVANNLGRNLTLTYDTSNRVSTVSDGTGRMVVYGYDTAGNLNRYTDPSGAVTTYAYDQPGRLTQIFSPSNPGVALVTNTYDGLGRVRTQANANNASGFDTTWSYYFAGSRSEEVNPYGTRRVLYNNPRGKTLEEIRDYSGQYLATASTYDSFDRWVSATMPEGNSVSYTYDSKNNILTTTQTPKSGARDLDGRLLAPIVTSATYDPTYNQISSMTDGNGNVTCFIYDVGSSLNGSSHQANPTCPAMFVGGSGRNTGNLLQMVTPNQPGENGPAVKAKSMGYNSVGLPTSLTDEEGRITQYAYDVFGNRLSELVDVNGLKLCASMSYTGQGDVASRTDARGVTVSGTSCVAQANSPYTTTYTYDRNRRQVRSTILDTATAMSYDADGRVVQMARQAGPNQWRYTRMSYSPSGQPISQTDPSGRTVQMQYDRLDRLSTTTLASGRTMTNAYDALSRVMTLTEGVGPNGLDPSLTVNLGSVQRRTNTYTPNGQLASVTDGNNHAITYTYDGFDRLQRRIYADGAYEGMIYDANGNATVLRTRASKDQYDRIRQDFDRNNRLVDRGVPAIYDQFDQLKVSGADYSYSYDYSGLARDNIVTRTTYPPDGGYVQDKHSITYGYDSAGRRTSETNEAGQVVSWMLDAAGNRTRLTWPDGYNVTYAFDALNRMSDVYEGIGTTGLRLGHYSYNPLSERTSLTYFSGISDTYSYDLAGRISRITYGSFGPSSADFPVSYLRNADGQIYRIREESGGSFSFLGYRGTNNTALGTQVTYTANNLNQYAGTGYDANGNALSNPYTGQVYLFDSENRLASVPSQYQGLNYLTFAYDPLGRRAAKTVRFDYTGQYPPVTVNYLSAGDQEIAEQFVDLNQNNRLNRFIPGSTLDEPLALVVQDTGQPTARGYYRFDGQGSVLFGARGETGGYDAYGNGGGNAGDGYYFASRRWDQETNLYYNRARYYSPQLGRFLSPDPIGIQGGLNLYAYAGNDPVNNTDPTGLVGEGTGAGFRAGFFGDDTDFFGKFPTGSTAYRIGASTGLIGGFVSRTAAEVGSYLVGDGILRGLFGFGASGLGDLTVGEVRTIQSVVNQAGRPIEVVGSAARAARTITSDIDYVVSPSSLRYFEGLEGRLPGIDRHGLIPGYGDPNIGPAIRFIPR
ncbi:MAG TPA: RHS repeat-associated core domain-containing protein [Dongiaceae bacterium]|jgi:RHS repeat-associated protein|nr:RHS repeat-associated core domain-containing protein [Dongiaceae bacterium]